MRNGPLLIAVVDDEASVRTALQRLLRSAGMEVEVFADGEAFLQSLANHEPDCIVLDIHMPDVTGFNVLERLAKAGSSLPAIIMTGHDSPETHARALAAGCIAYLRKPIDDKVLLGAIQDAMNPGQAS